MRAGASACGDLLDPATVDEVVDIAAAPGGGQGFVDIRHRYAQRAGLGVVDVEGQFRHVLLSVGPHPTSTLVLRGHAQELVARRQQGVVAETPSGPATSTVKPPEVPSSITAGGTKANTMASRICEKAAMARPATDLTSVPWRRALIPGAQVHKGRCPCSAAAAKAEAGDGEQRTYRVLLVFEKVLLDLPSTARVRSWRAPAATSPG